MFWDKSYTPSQNIEALLEKENATVEEFLDDDDILLECRSQKKSIVIYFTRTDVIRRLVELITTEPSEDLPLAQRYRHAHMACEILTLGLPSLDEKLLSDEHILETLYSYLENEPPLNPLLSSFFSKTFSMLFTKKAEQDWFLNQQMCLKLLEYIKSQNNFLDLICKHFSTPVIPDLIMQMMREVEGQMKRNLYEWLTEDKLVERLIELIGNPQEIDKHANVAEFLCDLIQQGRSMRYTEQENDTFEPTFDGSNPILKCIESERNVEALLNVILEPNAQESAVVSGISVVLMLLKPVVFTDEPNSDRMKFIQNREKEIREQILSTVISVIAPRLKDFNELLRNPPNKPELVTTAAKLSQPFGMTRLQICRIFTVLLQTKNETISKAVCETDFFETLLILFKQYCWNNFLHSEVEKCLQLVFYTKLSNNNNSMQGSTIVNDGSFNKTGNNVENTSFFDFIFKSDNSKDENFEVNEANKNVEKEEKSSVEKEDVEMKTDEQIGEGKGEIATEEKSESNETAANANAMETDEGTVEKVTENAEAPTTSDVDEERKEDEINEQNKTKAQTDSVPSALQIHVIEKCKLISKLIDCWKYNTEMESAEKGRRLGYMGHLIKIFKHITNSISESEHIGALIESSLSDEFELKLWQSIINPTDGDLTKALATQNKMLANCNAHEAGDYSPHLSKDFDNSTWDYIMSSNMISNLGFNDSGSNFGRNIDDDDDEDDENNAGGAGSGGGGTGSSLFGKNAVSTSALQAFGVTNNPWDDMDPFSDLTANSNATPWTADFNSDNFADFDSHFSSFANDLGESLVSAASTTPENAAGKENSNNGDGSTAATVSNQVQRNTTDNGAILSDISRTIAPAFTSSKAETGYDNNANVEKSITLVTQEIGEFADGTDVADDLDVSSEKALATSLVRTLQSVMQDSEDDYEDDEGMWTKPLGGRAVDAHDDESDDSDQKSNELSFTNGPSSQEVHANDNTHKLNKTDDDDSSTIAAAHINENAGSENVQVAATISDAKRTSSSISLDTIADVGCNATAVAKASSTSNAVEIAPTTT
ncbi:serine/threonine-protein phosphatase 6 regulatory subunit 3 isoform X3 [Bactrocera neohumeralis]|uniref:serine/threonine-protein phosphatase 6 regulatory subunit 3 isoform X3 n=1 Tax=Bactrocera tryoni TaxID=59916 RepID=UPI001A9987BB|nr:serine/threonine-protein phosphatase 6 regulatory subunit 3 isoform X3 [Bactrocera tryoni]XP_050332929.1 serine/threonine-protein phosphatase 6 regulatory subunit 3 isoform X3 [Bactrocera neohumeralis]